MKRSKGRGYNVAGDLQYSPLCWEFRHCIYFPIKAQWLKKMLPNSCRRFQVNVEFQACVSFTRRNDESSHSIATSSFSQVVNFISREGSDHKEASLIKRKGKYQFMLLKYLVLQKSVPVDPNQRKSILFVNQLTIPHGKRVSTDHLVSGQPDLIPQMSEFLTNLRISGALVSVDHFLTTYRCI